MQKGSGVFAHLEFPEYQFQEYPKWIKDANGQDVVVNDRDEEARATRSARVPSSTKKGEAAKTVTVESGPEAAQEPEEDEDENTDGDENSEDEGDAEEAEGDEEEDTEEAKRAAEEAERKAEAERAAARERAKARRAAKKKK